MFPVKQNLAICALASTLLLGAAPLPDEGGTGRFTMTPADNGVLKLDTQTGAMSMCSRKGASWACETLPDDRQKLQTEIDRLAAENQDLKATVKRLEDSGVTPGDGLTMKPNRLPSEEDVGKAMDYVHGLLRKFKEKLREFKDLDDDGGTRL